MFFPPGKSRSISRVRHETAESRFLAKQLDLFAGSNISSPVRTERSEASTAGTGEEKLYVLVTRKVSLTGEKKIHDANLSNPASVADLQPIETCISKNHHSQILGGCKVSLTNNDILQQKQVVECAS